MTVHFIGAGPGAADLLTLRGRDLIAGFAKLLTLSDDDVTRILTFLMAETLEAHTPMIEMLGQQLETDPMRDWSPDEAFIDLLRDKEVINAMIGELAGEPAAKGNVTATAKVQKGILKDRISGEREAAENWRPRYMAFPMGAYTSRGGIEAVEAAREVAQAEGEVEAEVEPAMEVETAEAA